MYPNVSSEEKFYSSSYWLIWRLRRPRFHDMPKISRTTWCEIQTCGFVNARIHFLRKVEREVNLKMAKKIKANGEPHGGKVTACKPNRTRIITVILGSMKKEEGQEERLSEHQFSLL